MGRVEKNQRLRLHPYCLSNFIFERLFCISGHIVRIVFSLFLCFLIAGACSTGSPRAPSSTEPPILPTTERRSSELRSPNTQSAEAGERSESSIQPDGAVSAVSVGRALEHGDVQTATTLAKTLPNSPAASLIKAKVAEALGDDETAVRMYHELTDALPEFERIRIDLLSDALARLGRTDEAAQQLNTLLKTDSSLSKTERFSFEMKMGKWFFDSKKPKESLDVLKQAEKDAPTAASKDRAILLSIPILLLDKKLKESSALLDGLVSKPTSRENLLSALSLLKEQKIPFRWTDERRLTVAKTLIDFRAYETALGLLKEVQKTKHPIKSEQETQWLIAQSLFKRRGHYKEAVAVLQPIAAGGGSYADEAEFLAARALSRLDRDDEAIRAYRSYAAKTKRKAKAAEARFLAARLEYYLGRHKQALAALERLVGRGGNAASPKSSPLTPSDTRDAHFTAGMCAFSVGMFTRAEPHFVQASDGTSDSEVLKRNEYWAAASKAAALKNGWEKALLSVCEKDPTDWYARMAAARLEDAKVELGPCDLSRAVHIERESEVEDAGVPDNVRGAESDEARTAVTAQAFAAKANTAPATAGNDAPRATPPPPKPLAEISKVAALFAEAGLFREAADILQELEKKGAVKLPPAEWIAQYTALEAPQYAISRASSLFKWPPEGNAEGIVAASYPIPYRSLAEEVESKMKLPDKLIFAIARKESLFDPKAVSRVGAMGLMQMMPGTYEANRKRAGLSPLKKGALPGPEDSIRAAGYEFQHLFEKFNSLPLAVMAYNAGEAAVDRWVKRSSGVPLDIFIEKAGFAETRNYVRRVTKNLLRYRLIYGGPPLELPRAVEKSKTSRTQDSPIDKDTEAFDD